MFLEHLTAKTNLIELWTTEVGSGMWGMETYASDHDFVTIYACRDFDVLTGRVVNTLRQKTNLTIEGYDKKVDLSAMEIGHFVHLLMKGNVNAIWAITSPRVISSMTDNLFQPEYALLRKLVFENTSKATYHSIRGMTHSQLADVTKRAEVRDPKKTLATAMRTACFGIHFLKTGEIKYLNPNRPSGGFLGKYEYHKSDVEHALDKLDKAFERSTLPDVVPQQPFLEYLYGIRQKAGRVDGAYFARRAGATPIKRWEC